MIAKVVDKITAEIVNKCIKDEIILQFGSPNSIIMDLHAAYDPYDEKLGKGVQY